VVGAFYYLRVIKVMYFDEPVASFEPMAVELKVIVGLSGAFVLLFIFIAGPINGAAEFAAKTFF
jgi:NADH-quinone oxidoreductase subunit N